MMRKLLILLAVAISSMAARADAMGLPLATQSAVARRSHDVAPNRSTATVNRTTNVWWVVGTATIIVLGSVGLALWTERRRPDDGGFSGGDDGGGGGPDHPRAPRGPRGEDPTWGLFEAEFREYVRSLEAAGSGASPRPRGRRPPGRDS